MYFLEVNHTLIMITAMVVYCIPTIIAVIKDHPNVGGIIIVNILFGCTIIGWILALVWVLLDSVQNPKFDKSNKKIVEY